jgi:hypothetical protein
MSLITKINKKEVTFFINSLKRKIKKENPKKRLYSSVYHMINLSNFLDSDASVITGEIGAVIKEGFFPFGKTLVKVIVPGEIRADSSLYEYLQEDVSKFSRKCTLAYFEEN